MTRSKVDYATDQITVYRYCRYACRYCYVLNNKLFISRLKRSKYDPVDEARKYLRKTGRVIVVSFLTDPYPPEEYHEKKTRRVLEVLAKSRNKVMVLTKNPVLALRDLDIMSNSTAEFYLGTTIVTLDENEALYYEPLAPKPHNRITALMIAKRHGVKTWISIEPIIPEVTNLNEIISTTKDYVDYYVLGRLNYSRIIRSLGLSEEQLVRWYKRHVPKALRLLESLGKQYHVKHELRQVLESKT